MNDTFIVSFPRSGSHWIRISLESYLGGKSPLSNFFNMMSVSLEQYQHMDLSKDFKGTHDLDLLFENSFVLYIYRNPIDTIFSQLMYCEIDLNNLQKIDELTYLWIRHINKWIFDENFTKKKEIIQYEKLQNSFELEFAKVIDYFSIARDSKKMVFIKDSITKQRIAQIVHDKKLFNYINCILIMKFFSTIFVIFI